MTINSIFPVSSPPDAENSTAQRADPLNRDAFMSLLVTQLTHQNPLEPQADGEFLAQLAQFSSLESLTAIRDDIAALRAHLEASARAPQNPQ